MTHSGFNVKCPFHTFMAGVIAVVATYALVNYANKNYNKKEKSNDIGVVKIIIIIIIIILLLLLLLLLLY